MKDRNETSIVERFECVQSMLTSEQMLTILAIEGLNPNDIDAHFLPEIPMFHLIKDNRDVRRTTAAGLAEIVKEQRWNTRYLLSARIVSEEETQQIEKAVLRLYGQSCCSACATKTNQIAQFSTSDEQKREPTILENALGKR